MEEFVRDMDLTLVQMEVATLRRINEALARLEEGTYGVCGECRETISEARLKALPFAVLCLACQEAAERQEGRVPSRACSHDRVEQVLSISARNERAPAGFQAKQLELYDYASVLLTAQGREDDDQPASVPRPLAVVPRPVARPRRLALRDSLVSRGPRAARRARA